MIMGGRVMKLEEKFCLFHTACTEGFRCQVSYKTMHASGRQLAQKASSRGDLPRP